MPDLLYWGMGISTHMTAQETAVCQELRSLTELIYCPCSVSCFSLRRLQKGSALLIVEGIHQDIAQEREMGGGL